MFGKKPTLEDTLFQLKFSQKQLDRHARNAEKEQKVQQEKVKKALQQKNVEGARIYAENSIRKKNEALNYMRLASRLDAVQSKIKSAMAMNNVTKQIGHISKDLERAMASLDLEKVDAIMSKFETQFEDLDVRAGVVEGAMGNAVTLSAPENQVAALISQVAEENGLEVQAQLAGITSTPAGLSEGGAATASRNTVGAETEDPDREQQRDLDRRLAQLRN